jgi:hypothetical protein
MAGGLFACPSPRWSPPSGAMRRPVAPRGHGRGRYPSCLSRRRCPPLRQLPRLAHLPWPWKAQAAVLATPRTAAALYAAAAFPSLGATGTLALHVGLQALGTAAALLGGRCRAAPPRPDGDRARDAGSAARQRDPVRLLHISDVHMERPTQREEELLALVDAANPTSSSSPAISSTSPTIAMKPPSSRSSIYCAVCTPPTASTPRWAARRSIYARLCRRSLRCSHRLLRDEWQTVDIGGGRHLHLLGSTVPTIATRMRSGWPLSHAGRPSGSVHVLLYHSPELMPEASANTTSTSTSVVTPMVGRSAAVRRPGRHQLAAGAALRHGPL